MKLSFLQQGVKYLVIIFQKLLIAHFREKYEIDNYF